MKDPILELYEILRDEVFSKVTVLNWHICSSCYDGAVKIEYKSPAGEWHYLKFDYNPETHEITRIKESWKFD